MDTEQTTKPCQECGEYMEFNPETEQTKCPACELIETLQAPPEQEINLDPLPQALTITETKVEDSIYSLPPVENPRFALIRLTEYAEQIAYPIESKLLYDKPVLVNFAHHVLSGTEGITKFILADAFLAVFAQAVMTLRGKV